MAQIIRLFWAPFGTMASSWDDSWGGEIARSGGANGDGWNRDGWDGWRDDRWKSSGDGWWTRSGGDQSNGWEERTGDGERLWSGGLFNGGGAAVAAETNRPGAGRITSDDADDDAAVAAKEQIDRLDLPVGHLTIEYFKEGYAREKDWSGTYRMHNMALKGYRHAILEGFADVRIVEITFPVRGAHAAPLVEHNLSGMNFAVHEDRQWMWNWKEMVAQLTDESMKIVVDGPGGRSGGLVACTFSARPNSYDLGVLVQTCGPYGSCRSSKIRLLLAPR